MYAFQLPRYLQRETCNYEIHMTVKWIYVMQCKGIYPRR
jgi:hypothetical protein